MWTCMFPGVYTAPYDGSYLFSAHLQTMETTGSVGLQIHVDGANTYSDTNVDEPDRSTTLMVVLSQGQVMNKYLSHTSI